LSFGNTINFIKITDKSENLVLIPTDILPKSIIFLGRIKEPKIFCTVKTDFINDKLEFSISPIVSKDFIKGPFLSQNEFLDDRRMYKYKSI